MSPDTNTTPSPEHHPFDPEVRTRLTAFLNAVPESIITIAIRHRASLRRKDLQQLLERDEWSDATRLELAEKCARYRSERDDFHAEADAYINSLAAARAERDQARELAREAIDHLERQVGNEDDPCHFDHHGGCQTHFKDGSERGKCGTTEARTFLAALPDPIPDWIDDSPSSPNTPHAGT